MPRRPPNGIADPVWDFLEMCWSRDPTKRPSITHVRNALSQSPSFPPPSPSLPPRTPEERPTVGELPGNLKVQSVKISFNEPKQRKFYVKFKYGDKSHMTSRTAKTAASDEHTWFAFHPFLPSLSSLSFKQECSRNLVDRNQRAESRSAGHLRGIPDPDIYVEEGQDLRDREVLRKYITTAQRPE